MRSGVAPFRSVRFGRNLMIHHRIDPYKFHCYWPSLIEDELAEFKRIEYIKWKDEVVVPPRRGRSASPAGRRNDRPRIE